MGDLWEYLAAIYTELDASTMETLEESGWNVDDVDGLPEKLRYQNLKNGTKIIRELGWIQINYESAHGTLMYYFRRLK